MSVFEAERCLDNMAGPYRSTLSRSWLTPPRPCPPPWPASVLESDLSAAYGSDWPRRLVDFDETPAATASIGQVHRGRWRDDRGKIIDVAVKVQYPGIAKALHSDLRAARVFGRIMAQATGLDIAGLTGEIAARFVDELDYVREGRVQNETAAAFAQPVPKALVLAHAAGAHEPFGRTSVVVPHVYAAMPRVLVSTWLDGAPLTALLHDGDTRLPSGWRELSHDHAANQAALLDRPRRLRSSRLHRLDAHRSPPGNFLLLPDLRLGLLDFGSVASMPDGPPQALGTSPPPSSPATDRPPSAGPDTRARSLPDTVVDPGLLLELLHPIVAPTGEDNFTYSPAWLRALMTHLADPRFAGIRRNMTSLTRIRPRLAGSCSVAGLYARLGATVPSRALELAYSPGFRNATSASSAPNRSHRPRRAS